jgi:hypothetical protein
MASATLNNSSSTGVRHHSASHSDGKDPIESKYKQVVSLLICILIDCSFSTLNQPASSRIDPKYFQFTSNNENNGYQGLRSSVSAGNVQHSSRSNATSNITSMNNKPYSAQQTRPIRQNSASTTPLASAYSSEKQM